VRSQLVGKLRSDRNQTRLEELRAANSDDPFGEIDILQGQVQCLTDTHAGSVEKQQQRAVRRGDVATVAGVQDLCRVQQSAQLVGRVDVGRLLPRQLGQSCRERRAVDVSAADGESV
jgi:hypothetical protein